jgi:hypothetical protein
MLLLFAISSNLLGRAAIWTQDVVSDVVAWNRTFIPAGCNIPGCGTDSERDQSCLPDHCQEHKNKLFKPGRGIHGALLKNSKCVLTCMACPARLNCLDSQMASYCEFCVASNK